MTTMRKMRSTLLLIVALTVSAFGSVSASDNMTPLELVASTPKGGLRNPYSHASAAAEEGHKIYMSLDCSSCHGGGGGGGMAAPLTNPIWIYCNVGVPRRNRAAMRGDGSGFSPGARISAMASARLTPRTNIATSPAISKPSPPMSGLAACSTSNSGTRGESRAELR